MDRFRNIFESCGIAFYYTRNHRQYPWNTWRHRVCRDVWEESPQLTNLAQREGVCVEQEQIWEHRMQRCSQQAHFRSLRWTISFRCDGAVSNEPTTVGADDIGFTRCDNAAPKPSGYVTFVIEDVCDVEYKMNMRSFRLTNYLSERHWYNIPQVTDSWRPLRNVHEAHLTELRASFLWNPYDYACGIMTVSFAHVMHPKWGHGVTWCIPRVGPAIVSALGNGRWDVSVKGCPAVSLYWWLQIVQPRVFHHGIWYYTLRKISE